MVKSKNEAEEFVKWAESQFIVGRSTNRAFSVTDEPYVTLVSSGLKKEGQGVGLWVNTEEKAWDGLRAAFRSYVLPIAAIPSEEPYVLYWRKHPVLDQADGRWQARIRLLVSNKSVEKELLPGMKVLDAMDYEKQAKEKTRDKALGLDDLGLRKWAMEQAIKVCGNPHDVQIFALEYLKWVLGDPKARKNG